MEKMSSIETIEIKVVRGGRIWIMISSRSCNFINISKYVFPTIQSSKSKDDASVHNIPMAFTGTSTQYTINQHFENNKYLVINFLWV